MSTPSVSQTLTEPIEVFVTISGTEAQVPDVVHIPWGYTGVVRWTISGDDAIFTDTGVRFRDENAPYVPLLIDLHHCEIQVSNTQLLFTGHSYEYDLVFADLTKLRNAVDPTVENDSPPPIPPMESLEGRS